MSHANLEAKALDAIDMSVTVNSDKMSTHDLDHGSMQAVWSGSSHADATVKLQTSHDGTNWDDLPSGSMTLDTAGAASKTLAFSLLNFPYCRFAYEKGSNTTGAMTLRFLFKSRK